MCEGAEADVQEYVQRLKALKWQVSNQCASILLCVHLSQLAVQLSNGGELPLGRLNVMVSMR